MMIKNVYKLVVCALLFGVVHMVRPEEQVEDVVVEMVEIPVDQAQLLLDVLENVLETRAPREGVNASNPAAPISPFNSAELAAISACVCAIKNKLDNMEDSSNVGDLTDVGSCFDAIITEGDIDGAELNAIEWLKTVMKEIRGVCP